METRALILAGGGAKGGFEVGVTKKWIVEDKLNYKIILGNSVGCINGVKLAHAPWSGGNEALAKEWGELAEWWDGLDNPHVYRKRWLWGLPALWNWSVYTTQPIQRMLKERIDPERLRNSGREFRGIYISWATGEILMFDQTDEHPAEKTYCSASFPVFFEPGEVGGELFTDGGLRDIAPLGHALEMGATHVDVILTSDPVPPDDWDTKGKKSLDFARRAIDIQSREILLGDVRTCQDRNLIGGLVAFCQAKGLAIPDEFKEAERFKPVVLRVLKPSASLGESFDFSPEATQRRIAQGYADACALD
jgi:NTE family protein